MVGSVSHINQPREASGKGVFILGDWRDTHIGFVKAGELREANCKNQISFCGMNWLLAFPERWDLTHPSHPWAGHGVATATQTPCSEYPQSVGGEGGRTQEETGEGKRERR